MKVAMAAARKQLTGVTLALLSGLLLGLSFPPADLSWLIWISLVPLLWATLDAPHARSAFAYGLITAVVFYLITTYPLMSAHSWSGWQAAATEAEQTALVSEQKRALLILWLIWPFFAGSFWALSTLALYSLNHSNYWRIAAFFPPLLIVLTEWIRSEISFRHHWSFIGNAALDIPGVLQLSSVGGVWLLSWLVILVNIGLLAVFRRAARPRREWKLAGAVVLILGSVVIWGSWHEKQLDRIPEGANQLRVAALQFHSEEYTPADFSSIGIEYSYLDLMLQISTGAIGNIDLLVLPESVAFAALSIDGSSVEGLPKELQAPLQDWEQSIAWIINEGESGLIIALGSETIERSKLFNSMTFWNSDGLQHVYHKQELVPFAEFQPESLKFFSFGQGIRFSPGTQSSVAEVSGWKVGSFICQEVLTPSVIRNSVRNGAQILISGGNDGVFSNLAISEVHAKVARIRAAETGRYIVRAMKTGVSAVISPTGKELSRSPSIDPYISVGSVRPMDSMTLYVRFGDWPIGIAIVLILVGIADYRRQKALPSAHQVRSKPLFRSVD